MHRRPAGAPAPANADHGQLPLRAVQRAVAASGGGKAPRGWWLQFGPGDAARSAAAIGALQVAGVQPRGLASVQLWHQGQVVYQLDSCTDARGNPVVAGDMLLAMARMDGHDALVVDARWLGLTPATTALRLLLTAGARASLRQARVTLLPR